MVTIEEYIAVRRKADQLDIGDIYSKSNNMNQCINYVVDYFNEHVVDLDLNETVTATTKFPEEEVLLSSLGSKIHMALIRFSNQYKFTPIETTTEFVSMFSVNLTNNRLVNNSNPHQSYNVRGLGRISLMKICNLDTRIKVIR